MARRKKPATPTSALEGRTGPLRVAIVGGGCAGLAAAWQLAKYGKKKVLVEVFEKSYRLGGKGASGRDEQGRIREHGLHVWMGFYENAFRMIRECYDEVRKNEWGPDSKDHPLAHGSFEDAFVAEPHIGVKVRSNCPPYDFWSGFFPPTEGTPGDPIDEDDNPFTLANYLVRCFMLLKALFQSVVEPADTPRMQGAPGHERPAGRSTLDEVLDESPHFDSARTPSAIMDSLSDYARTGALATAAGMQQAFRFLEMWARRMHEGPWRADTTLDLMQAVSSQLHKQLLDMTRMDPKLRWKTEVIDIVMTIAAGLYRDRVLFSEDGLDAINHMDYKDWLRKHGALESTVDSQFINGIYDLTFAYRNGDRTAPSLAAGVALRGALRMFFTYRGSMFWRMRSGMGDAVFAPLYRVLQAKGVEFRLLHELTKVDVAHEKDGALLVRKLQFEGHTSPKADLDGFGCWWHVEGALPPDAVKLKKPVVREAGKHFDAVILAMSVDDLRNLMSSVDATVTKLVPSGGDASTVTVPMGGEMPLQWRQAFRYQETVSTQSGQAWIDKDLPGLGWNRGAVLITGLPTGFQTWADMTHTLASERAWRERKGMALAPSQEPKSVAYFCGVVQEDPDPARRNVTQLRATRMSAIQDDMQQTMRELWPNAFPTRESTLSLSGDPHYQVNLEPPERYTQSIPGTVRYRISPLDDWIANMSVAGDWTACGIDAGCVESAVISGMLAAYAITNDQPAPHTIVGYDHP